MFISVQTVLSYSRSSKLISYILFLAAAWSLILISVTETAATPNADPVPIPAAAAAAAAASTGTGPGKDINNITSISGTTNNGFKYTAQETKLLKKVC